MDVEELKDAVHERFLAHGWHDASLWGEVEAQLAGALLDAALWMEETGGEPAVAPWWTADEPLVLCDCSPESPAGRRSLCYDRNAWEKRKKARPAGDATGLAAEHGARLLTEDEYLLLQSHGEFDRKTSSWLLTPDDVRSQGGALFGDRRFGRPFIYCNGAESYYGVRGFRVVTRA